MKPTKAEPTIGHRELVGCLTFGLNHPGIFLGLCEAFKDLNLDILDVDSHVRKGWFTKMIIGRNLNTELLPLSTFESRIRKVAKQYEIRAECFVLPRPKSLVRETGGVMIVVQSQNRSGLLADLLEALKVHEINIIDIKIEMDEDESWCTMSFLTHIPATQTNYFAKLEQLRESLRAFKDKSTSLEFKYLLHSIETFHFIHRIDYESSISNLE